MRGDPITHGIQWSQAGFILLSFHFVRTIYLNHYIKQPNLKKRRFNKAVVHRCLSLVGRKNCGRQPYGRKKIAGGNILAVSYECKAEIYRQKKTTIPGKNLGTKIGRKERGSFQLYKVEDRFGYGGRF